MVSKSVFFLIFKKFYQNWRSICPKILEKKRKILTGFLIDEIDAESYFLNNFLDVYIPQIRVILISTALFREAYKIKEYTFEPNNDYQSLKFTAEL